MPRGLFQSSVDLFFSFAALRKAYWRFWYPLVTRRVAKQPIFFLNYAFVDDPPVEFDLWAEDEANRPCIGLYQQVLSQVDLRDKDVLEVSCGHGGGASYLRRYFQPRRVTGLDLNGAGIALCRRHHALEGLDFVQGDAENLPFADETFDAVVNIEASHCYPRFSRFLAEVQRVLRRGGHFLYADFRFQEGRKAWEEAIAGSPLRIVSSRDISPQVLRGLDANSESSLRLVQRLLPRGLHWLGRDFAGAKGSRVYNSLQNGEMVYRMYCLEKV